MFYLNDQDISVAEIPWAHRIDAIDACLVALKEKRTDQPIKPYVRYGDRRNRIIAMPAYVDVQGGRAGIKWIASFPGNLDRGLPRAHSTMILNDVQTGRPYAIINGATLSAIRTAAVSGSFLRAAGLPEERCILGMSGFGPIGRTHVAMLMDTYGDQVVEIRVYDPRGADLSLLDPRHRDKMTVCNSWQEAYREAHVFLTCTASPERYIDEAPRPGSLQLNVSLRDYCVEIGRHVDNWIVDDWDEVCRENTDLEKMHEAGLVERSRARSLQDVFGSRELERRNPSSVTMFNPMGMGVFDLAIAGLYFDHIREQGGGIELPC